MTETDIIAEIEAYCAKVNLAPSTVCVRATGSSRLMGRLRRRAKKTEQDAARIRAFIAANPPQSQPEAAE